MLRYLTLIDNIILYSMYAYFFLIFLSKGEGVRNILIFGSFFLWLMTKGYRKKAPLKDPVSISFFLFLSVIALSAFFSLNPGYSIWQLQGDPLKGLVLFLVISTALSSEERLKPLPVIGLAASLLIVTTGYYSYLFHDLPLLKPDTSIMHAWHNKFARYLNTYHPFIFCLFFIWKRKSLKALVAGSLVYTVIALLLSTSRGGFLAFSTMLIIWLIYLTRKEGYNLRRLILSFLIFFLIVGTVSWFSSPYLRLRFKNTLSDIRTLNNRLPTWKTAIKAVKERPILGWGHGGRYFKDAKIYESAGLTVPRTGPENTFLKVLFHYGVGGLLIYILFLLISIYRFTRGAFGREGISSYILVACLSVLIGNYIVNAMLAVLRLKYLAVIVAIGVAAIHSENEDSHS